MTEPIDENDDAIKRRKKSGSEEGDAGAGNAISRMLTTKLAQRIQGEHKELKNASLITTLVDFCVDGAMIASANLSVVWEKTFTVVHAFIQFCAKELPQLAQNLQRTAARDGRTLQQKKPGMGMSLGPTGPTE